MSSYSDYGSRAAEIIQNKGRSIAQGQRASGEIWGSTIANLSQMIGGAAQQVMMTRAQEKQAAKEAEVERKLGDLFVEGSVPTAGQIINAVGPERGIKIATGLKALQTQIDPSDPQKAYAGTQKLLKDVLLGMDALPEGIRAQSYPQVRQNLVQRGVIQETDAPEAYDPSWWTQTLNYGKEPLAAQPENLVAVPGPPNPDGTPGAAVYGPKVAGQPVYEKPPAAGAGGGFSLSPGGVRYDAEGNVIASRPAAPAGAGSRMWVYRDGKPVRVAESEIRPGDTPASGREQGRPVTSGDANRLAEINQSITQAKELENIIGHTGTAPALGAALPNAITQATGIGVAAKTRQGQIAIVKQIIGKGLEGGVLRAEDEKKYAKILPTISDPPAVAKAKIKGLQQTLQDKQSALLDSLEDASYDTTRYRNRETAAPAAKPPAGRVGPYTYTVEQP